ncbi:MAG TPA: hypothetical protein VGD98_21575 [Ktedonobacteraceae bacterium]
MSFAETACQFGRWLSDFAMLLESNSRMNFLREFRGNRLSVWSLAI